MSDKKVDCFGCLITDTTSGVPADCSNKFMKKYKAVFNKEIGEYEISEDDPLDLDAVVQTYKDDCGTELVRAMLKRGEDVSQFADDGKHSADISNLPDNLNDAYRAAASSEEVVKSIADKLGVSVDDLKNADDLNSVFQAAVDKQKAVKETVKTDEVAGKVKDE